MCYPTQSPEHVPLTVLVNNLFQIVLVLDDLLVLAVRIARDGPIGVVPEHALDHVAVGSVALRDEGSLVPERDLGQEQVVEKGLGVGAGMVVTEPDKMVGVALVYVLLPAVAPDQILGPAGKGFGADFVLCVVPLYEDQTGEGGGVGWRYLIRNIMMMFQNWHSTPPTPMLTSNKTHWGRVRASISAVSGRDM